LNTYANGAGDLSVKSTYGSKARDAWQRLYSKRGLHYGGSGDISLLRPHLKRSMLVLDAGCGDGKTSEILSRHCEVLACDFSREALCSLRSQRDHDRVIDMVECNLLKLPFAPKKFDAVTCVHALSHLPEDERADAAGQLESVLVPGGHLYIEVFGRGDVRYGKGEEVENSSFLRGDGIMTHYFQEGEVQHLFPSMELVTEIGTMRRIVFGVTAGKRDILKILLRRR
jgi:SAM-dependent methyltransferase